MTGKEIPPEITAGSWEELGAPIAALRTAVFIEEQGVPEDEVFDGADQRAAHFALLENGEAIAAARLYEEGPQRWRIGWVATAKERRGQGLGAAVIRAALGYAAAHGGGEAALDAQDTAVPFYEKLGFRQAGERVRFPSGFVLVPMRLQLVGGS